MARLAACISSSIKLGERALIVGIAGQGGSNLRLLTECAQRRAFAEIAGLNDDAAFVGRCGDNSFDRRGNIAGTCLHQYGASAAEQRDRVRFLHKPCRIARQLIALDTRQREWIIGIVDRRAHQRVHPLAHQA